VSDTVAEVPGPTTEIPQEPASPGPPARRVLLVWDAPILDMGLGAILGRRPSGVTTSAPSSGQSRSQVWRWPGESAECR
jgi:hypothetical protein